MASEALAPKSWSVFRATVTAVAGMALMISPAMAENIVHRIYLKDAEGNIIKPDDKGAGAYSPAKTCGQCHEYETIGHGTHEVMRPDTPLNAPATFPGRNWILTHRESGMQAHPSMNFIPPKKNPGGGGLPPWIFAKEFGGYHVGGGMLERDSDGKNYVEVMSGDEFPPEELSDYQGAWWDYSGVIEVDCLMCHGGDDYEPVFRAVQIKEYGNFKWAPMQAAGVGTAKGAVTNVIENENAPLPKLRYNSRVFSEDLTACVDVEAPTMKRCLFCHRFSPREAPERIDETTDIHFTSGLTCIDCHRTGLEHKPSPGYERPGQATEATEEDDMISSKSLTCKGCHTTGRAGAPVALHKGLPEMHLDEIACTGCHSGPAPKQTPEAIQAIANPCWAELKGDHREEYRGPIWHMPIFKKDEFGQIRVYQRLLPSYWAIADAEGSLQGLLPEEITDPIESIAEEIKDDDEDDLPEVNTEEEIKASIQAISEAVEDRLKKDRKVVYLRGGKRYELADGEMQSAADEAADPVDWPMGHNVRPAAQALGADGCTDCHSIDAPFLFAQAPVDGLSPEGETIGVSMTELEGQDDLFHKAFALSFIVRPLFKITCLCAAGILAAIVFFYGIAGITGYRRED